MTSKLGELLRTGVHRSIPGSDRLEPVDSDKLLSDSEVVALFFSEANIHRSIEALYKLEAFAKHIHQKRKELCSDATVNDSIPPPFSIIVVSLGVSSTDLSNQIDDLDRNYVYGVKRLFGNVETLMTFCGINSSMVIMPEICLFNSRTGEILSTEGKNMLLGDRLDTDDIVSSSRSNCFKVKIVDAADAENRLTPLEPSVLVNPDDLVRALLYPGDIVTIRPIGDSLLTHTTHSDSIAVWVNRVKRMKLSSALYTDAADSDDSDNWTTDDEEEEELSGKLSRQHLSNRKHHPELVPPGHLLLSSFLARQIKVNDGDQVQLQYQPDVNEAQEVVLRVSPPLLRRCVAPLALFFGITPDNFTFHSSGNGSNSAPSAGQLGFRSAVETARGLLTAANESEAAKQQMPSLEEVSNAEVRNTTDNNRQERGESSEDHELPEGLTQQWALRIAQGECHYVPLVAGSLLPLHLSLNKRSAESQEEDAPHLDIAFVESTAPRFTTVVVGPETRIIIKTSQ